MRAETETAVDIQNVTRQPHPIAKEPDQNLVLDVQEKKMKHDKMCYVVNLLTLLVSYATVTCNKRSYVRSSDCSLISTIIQTHILYCYKWTVP